MYPEILQRSSLFAFAKSNSHIVPGGWSPEKLHFFLCNLFQDVVEEGRRIHVSVSPQMGKSTIASVFLPVWFLKNNPQSRTALVTYGQDLANTKSRQTRALINETYGPRLSRESSSVSDWKLEGSYDDNFRARGVGGALTGNPIDGLLILDDLIKGPEDAESSGQREKLWSYIEQVIWTRLAERTPVISIATRWHQDDYTVRLVKRLGLEYFNIPALCNSEDDLLGRQLGQSAAPRLKSRKFLLSIKNSISDYTWSALYQGQPVSRETSRIKREWFKYYDNTLVDKIRDNYNVYQVVDTSGTKSETSDYFVILTFAIVRHFNGEILTHESQINKYPETELSIFVLDSFRRKFDTTVHEEALHLQRVKWKPINQYVEAKTFGLNIIQNARKTGLPIKPLMADGSKVLRSERVHVYYRSGKVYHPEGASWVEAYENELVEFPSSQHDDQFDCASYMGIIAYEKGLK